MSGILVGSCTYAHQLCQNPCGSKSDRKTCGRKYPVHRTCTPRRDGLCILRIDEAQQQGIHIYLDSSEYLCLIPPIGQQLLFRSSVVCAVEPKLTQGICGRLDSQSRWVQGRHAVNCSFRRKVQSGLAVFPTSGPVNIHLQTRLDTGTERAFLRVGIHHKKKLPCSELVLQNARCLGCRTTHALGLPVFARWSPELSDTVSLQLGRPTYSKGPSDLIY